jgi:RNA processing factor Prp31
MIIYKNCLGVWVFNSDIKVVDNILFKPEELLEKLKDSSKEEKELKSKHAELNPPTQAQLKQILHFFKEQHVTNFYTPNLIITKNKLKESVNEDNFIIQAVSNIDELDKN